MARGSSPERPRAGLSQNWAKLFRNPMTGGKMFLPFASFPRPMVPVRATPRAGLSGGPRATWEDAGVEEERDGREGIPEAGPGLTAPMSIPPVILLCDHRGEGTADNARGLADAGYRLEQTENLRQTLARLSRLTPAVILVDPLASGGAVELDAIDRARGADHPVPVLVVADSRDPLPTVLVSRTLERGLWDLVHRDAPVEEYLMRIERLQNQRKKVAEIDELRHRAVHDDRTDLLRPKSFQERLREHFSAAQRHKLDLALLLIDLDRFGAINKDHDHTVGDALIGRVGEAIRRTLRAEDVAGRLGGDEFAVLLPYTRKVDAASVVQRLLEEIRALSGPLPGAKSEVTVSASIGFETFDGSDLDDDQALRMNTERALRHAKRSGGDVGVYFRSLARESAADE